jgi:hypothetical protein
MDPTPEDTNLVNRGDEAQTCDAGARSGHSSEKPASRFSLSYLRSSGRVWRHPGTTSPVDHPCFQTLRRPQSALLSMTIRTAEFDTLIV